MKKVFLLMCSLLLLFINVNCSYHKVDNKVPDQTVSDLRVPIIQKDDWLYMSGNISKVKVDGTGKTYIGNANGDIIAVEDEWIYYVDEHMGMIGSRGIYKTNGNKTISLTSDNYILEAVYYKGSIYYALGPSMDKDNVVKSGLYKIDSDGKNKVKITDQMVSCINIDDDYIYYSGASSVTNASTVTTEDVGIFKIKTNGTEKKRIYDKAVNYLKLSGNSLYFSNLDDNSKLYKINTDGTNGKKLNDDKTWDIVVSGSWIYYTVDPYDGHTAMTLPLDQTKGNIYKITTDGKERTKLNSETSRLCEVLDGWIYFTTWNDSKLHKMKLDGSSNLIVN